MMHLQFNQLSLANVGILLMFSLGLPNVALASAVEGLQSNPDKCLHELTVPILIEAPREYGFSFANVTVELIDESTVNETLTNEELRIAAESIAMVWVKHSSERKVLYLRILNELPFGFIGAYAAGVVHISKSGLAVLAGPRRLAQLIFISAHETTHAVQENRGDPTPNSVTDPTYPHNRWEYEANQTAADILKLFHPKGGTIAVHNKTYPLPDSSTYKRLPPQKNNPAN